MQAAASTLPVQGRKVRKLFGVPLVVALFFFGMMLPTSVSVNLGGLRLSVYRVVLLFTLLPMLFGLISGKRGKLNVFDMLAIGHCVWAALALINWGGLGQGSQSGGIYVIEFLGAYLVGRTYIRTYEDFAAMARFFVGSTCLMVVFTLPEALTGIHILHDGIAKAVGGPMAPWIDKRMGLFRAFGPFDHPILYGVFSAAAFSMAYFVIAERKLLNFKGMLQVFGVITAAFLSASGGPYTVLILQIFVASWQRALGKTPGRWKMLAGLFALIYIGIDTLSNRNPFQVFVTYLTFSAVSGYNRILIFQFGSAEVWRHPVFGIGLGDWIRPVYMSDSMDNFWLVVAVRYGLPALILLATLLIWLILKAGQRKGLPQTWRNARHAWAFTLFGIAVAAATVHLWNALFVLFIFLIGAGVWLIEAPLPDTKGPRRTSSPTVARGAISRLF